MIVHPPDRRLYLYFFPVVIMIAHPPDRRLYLFFSGRNKLSRHNKKTANFPPEPKTDTTAQPARQTKVSFFSGRNNDRAPTRQTTVSFFSGRNNDRAPARQTTVSFFSGCNNDRAPARQTTVSFFLVVKMIAHPPDRRQKN